MKTGTKKVGRYQQKMRQGMVPHVYDKSSKSFLAGAHKHWPSADRTKMKCRQIEHIDRKFLELARESR